MTTCLFVPRDGPAAQARLAFPQPVRAAVRVVARAAQLRGRDNERRLDDRPCAGSPLAAPVLRSGRCGSGPSGGGAGNKQTPRPSTARAKPATVDRPLCLTAHFLRHEGCRPSNFRPVWFLVLVVLENFDH